MAISILVNEVMFPTCCYHTGNKTTKVPSEKVITPKVGACGLSFSQSYTVFWTGASAVRGSSLTEDELVLLSSQE